MLVFLTSIRHPQNSNNFAQVEKLFGVSLRSICAQTDPNFSVVVVCNARPRIAYDDSRVIYHIVDFPPPSSERKAEIDFNAHLRDKGTKYLAGMVRARSLAPDYFMIFDADDLVSRRIAGFVNARPGTPGWYVDAAYALNHRTNRIQRKHGLVRYCGTSLLPNASDLYRIMGIDDTFSAHASQEEMVAKVPPWLIDNVLGNHPYMVGYWARHGLRMKPLPFRAAVWVQETGENHTMTTGVEGGLPLSPSFVQEFGLAEDTPIAETSPTFAQRLRETADCTQSWLGFLRHRLIGHPAAPPS